MPIHTILPEVCAFIVGFNFTVCTKMRFLVGSLADCVLADTILIPPRPPVPPTTIEGKGSSKKVRKLVTEKLFTSK